MSSIFFNSQMDDDDRRRHIHGGDLFIYSPSESSREFCEFSRDLVRSAFSPHDPITAQESMPVQEYVALLAELKPRFIHHPESKKFIQGILKDFGCDFEKTYFDVPRLRSMTNREYLSAGLALHFHPHRDTWYSAPPCQLNWWIPVFPIQPENTLCFYPAYWNQSVENSSNGYNYYEWNKTSRRAAALQVEKETRTQPEPLEELRPGSEIRIICPAGGVIIFSGAQMHGTVPNTSDQTRFSIDFRTVHVGEVAGQLGAPNIDSACTGTTMRDFLRAEDFARLPDELVESYDSASIPEGSELVYNPNSDEHEH